MDTVKINSIDQTMIANGIVNVDTTVTVNGTPYDNVVTSSNTDPVGVAADVLQQSETFRQQAQATSSVITSTTDLTTLVGKTINL